MKAEELAATLHPLEVRVLEAVGDRDSFSDRDIAKSGVVTESQARTVVEWQLAKGCMEVLGSTEEKWVELTDLGRGYLEGTPEERLLAEVRRKGGVAVRDLMAFEGIDKREAGSALGMLKKAGVLQDAGPGQVAWVDGADLGPIEALGRLIRRVGEAQRIELELLSGEDVDRVEKASRKRGKSKGVFRVGADSTRRLKFTRLGLDVRAAARRAGRSGDEVNLLTPEMLADGVWRGKTFRRYNLDISPPRRVGGRRHPYREFLDFVRRKLIGLGFEEMRGELVETEFWNMDALFMPQFHSARDIHDAYFIKEPSLAPEIEEPYASHVAAVHQNGGETGSSGWGYEFDHQRSRRLQLRSQGTVLSARWLKEARVPGKYFALARCFRPDQVDATHAADFFQCEGIVLGEDIDFVTLLGLLKLFAEEVAKAKDVKFAPAYFPFTEPSVEVHIRHPQVGWMELGGAGIFRPEVAGPQGVEVPVIAWGLGLDRMAMMALGIDDIRDLFSTSLNQVRATRICMKE
jgi:phenylalanyl-tRNA synthetase alpha chain